MLAIFQQIMYLKWVEKFLFWFSKKSEFKPKLNGKYRPWVPRVGQNLQPFTKFGIDQVRGSKDIEQRTQWACKSGLILTFEHLTWKSIGIIYLLRATPAPSLVLIKWRGQKILSGQHLVYRPTDRPTDIPTDRQLQNNMPPSSRGA